MSYYSAGSSYSYSSYSSTSYSYQQTTTYSSQTTYSYGPGYATATTQSSSSQSSSYSYSSSYGSSYSYNDYSVVYDVQEPEIVICYEETPEFDISYITEAPSVRIEEDGVYVEAEPELAESTSFYENVDEVYTPVALDAEEDEGEQVEYTVDTDVIITDILDAIDNDIIIDDTPALDGVDERIYQTTVADPLPETDAYYYCGAEPVVCYETVETQTPGAIDLTDYTDC